MDLERSWDRLIGMTVSASLFSDQPPTETTARHRDTVCVYLKEIATYKRSSSR
jgi:hypothetical protein